MMQQPCLKCGQRTVILITSFDRSEYEITQYHHKDGQVCEILTLLSIVEKARKEQTEYYEQGITSKST